MCYRTDRPFAVSVIPDDAAAKLSDSQFRDSLAYLMLPPPRMSFDAKELAPPPRTCEEVATILEGAKEPSNPLKHLNLLLVAGVKGPVVTIMRRTKRARARRGSR